MRSPLFALIALGMIALPVGFAEAKSRGGGSSASASSSAGSKPSTATKPDADAKAGGGTRVVVGVRTGKEEEKKDDVTVYPRRPYVPPPKFDPPPKIEPVSHGVPVPMLGKASASTKAAPGFEKVN